MTSAATRSMSNRRFASAKRPACLKRSAWIAASRHSSQSTASMIGGVLSGLSNVSSWFVKHSVGQLASFRSTTNALLLAGFISLAVSGCAATPTSCVAALDAADNITGNAHDLAGETDFYRNQIRPLAESALTYDAARVRRIARRIRIHDARVERVGRSYQKNLDTYSKTSDQCRAM